MIGRLLLRAITAERARTHVSTRGIIDRDVGKSGLTASQAFSRKHFDKAIRFRVELRPYRERGNSWLERVKVASRDIHRSRVYSEHERRRGEGRDKRNLPSRGIRVSFVSNAHFSSFLYLPLLPLKLEEHRAVEMRGVELITALAMTEGSAIVPSMIREEWKDANERSVREERRRRSGVSATGVPLAPIT